MLGYDESNWLGGDLCERESEQLYNLDQTDTELMQGGLSNSSSSSADVFGREFRSRKGNYAKNITEALDFFGSSSTIRLYIYSYKCKLVDASF